MANGRLLHSQPAGGDGRLGWQLTHRQADWLVLEIRAASDALLAISNPIFC
jgi:hypothetical protein